MNDDIIAMGSASLDDFRPYDPTVTYTPKALEPYDALADRFVRAVECALRYFRSREMLELIAGEFGGELNRLLGKLQLTASH